MCEGMIKNSTSHLRGRVKPHGEKKKIRKKKLVILYLRNLVLDGGKKKKKISRIFRKFLYKMEGITKPVSKLRQRSTFNSLFILLRSADLFLLYKLKNISNITLLYST